MKISTKGRYGVRAALELAIRYGQGPVMVREIAEIQNISERYLEQILNSLRTSNLVKSTRGAKGGYELAKHPSQITMASIVLSLEGPIDVVNCTGEENCGMRSSCAATTVWSEIKTAIEKVLDSITLDDLAEKQRALSKNNVLDFNI
jgi:Rrf2 family protein